MISVNTISVIIKPDLGYRQDQAIIEIIGFLLEKDLPEATMLLNDHEYKINIGSICDFVLTKEEIG